MTDRDRRRWRPGPLLVGLAAAASGWFAVLNAVTFFGVVPLALHGREVSVTVRRCSAGGCRGDYRLGPLLRTDQRITGAETARVGSVVAATVDGRDPGEASTSDAPQVAAEAGLFALAAATITVLAVRAAVRAAARTRAASAAAEPQAADPLAWARRRKFGAR